MAPPVFPPEDTDEESPRTQEASIEKKRPEEKGRKRKREEKEEEDRWGLGGEARKEWKAPLADDRTDSHQHSEFSGREERQRRLAKFCWASEIDDLVRSLVLDDGGGAVVANRVMREWPLEKLKAICKGIGPIPLSQLVAGWPGELVAPLLGKRSDQELARCAT